MDQDFLADCRQAVAHQARGDWGTAMVRETVIRQRLKHFGRFGDEEGAYQWLLGEFALARGQSQEAAKLLLAAAKQLRRSRQAEATNADLLVDLYASLGRAALRSKRYSGAVQAMKVSIIRATRVDGANTWPRILSVTPRLAGALYLAGDETADRVLAEGFRRTRSHCPEMEDAYIEQAITMLRSIGRGSEADLWQERSLTLA